MKYENGKPYIFRYGNCVVRVTLQNFRPEAVEKFNKTLAYEKMKAYEQRSLQNALPED